ncbi:endonuclease/exonuclease/phosphatase family protein [Sphingomonas sp. KR1UV-12]|uniref:Endonuclease/exonuclease/phosphatase family protein n=1 Tax=Sphingomonas aurea TaxID=3063994 RepID=A0ABT9EKT8_9SPHN|nr:endonuclease/exonuclease/phosphatase family protein [Sphingomonas sp. KR1UV-12]MDP1027582.1 endonuclease/exonuclease/phosphatase family protein [Sphingomonas sp. KR1UV-12]
MMIGRWIGAGLVAMAATTVAMPAAATPAGLSVMTYNVDGLPWPLASGRPEAMAAIAAQLRALRRAGRQPAVVALQEAFGDDAKAIGQAAGYRYMAVGPARDQSPPAQTASDRRFMDDGSIFAGERLGKRVDSGLVIFSDNPILAVRRMAYSVCAGYDCLANKGALAALIAVPGAGPVTVIDTHLNSACASGVPRARHRYAYRRQLEQLAGFEQSLARPDTVMLTAGDFNVGQDPRRNADFRTRFVAASGRLGIAAANGVRVAAAGLNDLRASLQRRKDWLLYRPSAFYAVRPIELTPFGRDRDGTMLSDHIGVVVRYGLRALTGGASITAARDRAVTRAST